MGVKPSSHNSKWNKTVNMCLLQEKKIRFIQSVLKKFENDSNKGELKQHLRRLAIKILCLNRKL